MKYVLNIVSNDSDTQSEHYTPEAAMNEALHQMKVLRQYSQVVAIVTLDGETIFKASANPATDKAKKIIKDWVTVEV